MSLKKNNNKLALVTTLLSMQQLRTKSKDYLAQN